MHAYGLKEYDALIVLVFDDAGLLAHAQLQGLQPLGAPSNTLMRSCRGSNQRVSHQAFKLTHACILIVR